jgi:hypothetical protein
MLRRRGPRNAEYAGANDGTDAQADKPERPQRSLEFGVPPGGFTYWLVVFSSHGVIISLLPVPGARLTGSNLRQTQCAMLKRFTPPVEMPEFPGLTD